MKEILREIEDIKNQLYWMSCSSNWHSGLNTEADLLESRLEYLESLAH